MATILNRVAQAVRDLKMLNVIKENDDVRFCFLEERSCYFVWIILCEERPNQDFEGNLTTIKNCFEQEFQEEISKSRIASKEKLNLRNEFKCFISAN